MELFDTSGLVGKHNGGHFQCFEKIWYLTEIVHTWYNYVPIKTFPTIQKKKRIILALTTAKRVLLRHGRKKKPPHYEEWLMTMVKLASYEKVTYDLLDKLYQYNCIWSPFTNWLSVT